MRTLRDDPADAEVPSHRLLVRAGYIRRAAPGHLLLAAARAAGAAQRRAASSARRWTRSAPRRCYFPALLPREPYEATGRWTEYGDSIFRLKDRKGADYLLGPTHEEMFTLAGQGPVLVLQGPAAVALPDPDQVPRRGAAARRAAARPRVRDEGLLLLRRRRRGPRARPTRRTARPTSGSSTGSASTTSSSRRRPARWAARRREEFLAARRGRRGHLRPLHAAATTPPTSRRSQVRAARAGRRTTTCRPPTPRTRPDTPTIETLVDHLNERFPRDDRPWTAADTLKNVLVVLVHPDGTREPLAIGVPGDREVDLKRLGGQLEPAEVEAHRRGRVRAAPGPGQGLHRPRRARRGERVRHPLPRRPARGRRHPLGDRRRRRRPPRRSTWSPAATSPPTAPSRPPRSATATPARSCGTAAARCETARGIEMGHIFQLGRKYAEALGPQGARRERQARHGHHGLLRHRRRPARSRRSPRTPTTSSGCAGRARWRPADVHIVGDRQGRRGLRGGRAAGRRAGRPRADACSTTTGRQGLARA